MRIISINDIYTLENLPRLATLIRAQRTSDAIVIIAGDFVGPSLLSSLDAGRGMIECLNALGVDYAILGNHEDDISPAELHRRVEEFRGTWISTNVDFDPAMPREVVVGDVVLIGVVMDDPAMYKGPAFGGAPVRSAHDDALAAVRGRKVVAITHQDIAQDRALAASGAFALIVGGHEHVPFVEQVGDTWVVKAGADGTAAVVTDLGREPRLVAIAGYDEDPVVRALVDRHMQKVRELAEATLVERAALSSVGTRVRQTSLGTLLCIRMRDAMHADVAVLNGGAIRASRDYPDRFTYGDLEAEVPFDNELVVVAMPGAVIKAAIAASRSHAPQESGGFLQCCCDPDSLDDARSYRLALVRNLFDGMDHNQPLIDFAKTNPIPAVGSGRDIKHVLAEAFAIELWKRLGGFDQIDANHDGVLEESEVLAALARISPHAPSHVIGHLMMHALDRDGDDLIERDEALR